MKTIDQLLELAKNPYYKFTQQEQEILDDFLLKKSEKDSETSQETNSKKSSDKTPVTVKNIVKKTSKYPPVAQESFSDERKA